MAKRVMLVRSRPVKILGISSQGDDSKCLVGMNVVRG